MLRIPGCLWDWVDLVMVDRNLGFPPHGATQKTAIINQRVPKANLWIINYCILETKADNEPAISLPVYFKSVKKWKYVLRKNKKTKGPKKRKRVRRRGSTRYLLRHDY